MASLFEWFLMFHIFTEMRFRFCGGEDCPDWLLAEIASLAAVSVVKVRQLTAEACRLLAEDQPIVPERMVALVADTKLQAKEVFLSCII